MKRRALFLSIAAGLLASLAVSMPARASSIVYNVTSDVIVTSGMATSATVVFSDPVVSGSVSNIVSNLPPLVVGTTGPGLDDVTFTFGGPAGTGTYFLDFTVSSTFSGLLGVGGTISGSGSHNPGGGVVVTGVSFIPEPTSMALLGIGMTGFFAFRRFFKRTNVA
jgi:PEP-CTERM motif